MIEPRPVTLEGHGVRLEPLDRSHTSALVRAAGDGDVWKLWYVSVADLEPGREDSYMDKALAGFEAGDMLPWVVRELGDGDIIGSTRYHDILPALDRVEIGYTFYAARWQRTHVNTACKRLLLGHAFDELGCAMVGFHVDQLNLRSQHAVERLGARLDGVLHRDGQRRDGSPKTTLVYSISSSDWPEVRARLEQRLEGAR